MRAVLQLLAASTALSSAAAFTIPTHHASSSIGRTSSLASLSNTALPTSRVGGASWRQSQKLSMASDDGEATAPAPRKRRKRKDGKQFAPPPAEEAAAATEPVVEEEAPPAPAPVPTTPKENVVVVKVRDVRDVVAGVPETPAVVEEEEDDDDDEYDDDDDDEELADDEEWEYYEVDDDGNEIITSEDTTTTNTGRSTGEDSMEQLLADARQFRSSSNDGNPLEEESSMKDTVFNVISTIVTVDFFVVMGLLVWFLAGIFCSTVLKDDAVQIAFNMNFERVTQPALGILMIGSVAGSFGNKDDEEE